MMIQRMQKLSALLTFAFLAFVISSCAAPTGPATSGDNSFGAAPIATVTSVSFSPSSTVTAGTEVTVTASIASANDVVGGELRLELYNDVTLNWDQVAAVTCAAGDDAATYVFTPGAVGTLNFRAHYVPSGGSGFSQNMSLTAPLTVIEGDCNGDVSLTVDNVSASISGSNVTYTIDYTVKACVDVNNVKLQGGLTAGVTNPSSTAGTITQKNKNYTCTWTIGNMTAGQSESYSVTFTKKMSAGTTNIAGSWSAKGVLASDGITPTAYNYTGVISYTM
jgi:hypothetical protein